MVHRGFLLVLSAVLPLYCAAAAFDSSEIRMLEDDYSTAKRSSGISRQGRSYDDMASPLIRFGKRTMDGTPLIRFGRAPEVGPLIRFGKRSMPDGAPLIRFGRAPEASPLIRFGKRSAAPLIRFGRAPEASPLIRFGRK